MICHDPATTCRPLLLQFARADLVAAMDPSLDAASEWRLAGATYHFLQVA
jgi:hypothetical protein